MEELGVPKVHQGLPEALSPSVKNATSEPSTCRVGSRELGEWKCKAVALLSVVQTVPLQWLLPLSVIKYNAKYCNELLMVSDYHN